MSTGLEYIGNYEVLEKLGAGAVGSAFKARHCQSREVVAVKLLHDRLVGDPDVQNRFVREVSVLEKLDHPNIVRHLDCGLDDGQLYFVMEWVEFGSLEEVLARRGYLPWRETVECAMQICEGLAHAHERGIIHRDLKPANLFLAADGHVKIGDFGLARDESLHRLTMKGNTVGSCRYMAPEQVRGDQQLTGAVDLYALGCLIYRLLTGEPPFDGATIMEIFEHHLFTDPPSLGAVKGDWPEELDNLVTRLLAKDPPVRPARAEEVREALAAIVAGTTVEVSFTTGDAAEQARFAGDDAPPAPNLTERLVEPDEQDVELSPWGTFIVLGGLVALLAVIAFIVMGQK